MNTVPPVRRIGYPLCLLAVFVLIGGQWAVLQTAAWTGMLFDYTCSFGLADGVSKTFDGDHPCKLCLKVKDGQKKDKESLPLLKAEKKGEAFLSQETNENEDLRFTALSHRIPENLFYPTRSDPLPLPVPRVLSC